VLPSSPPTSSLLEPVKGGLVEAGTRLDVVMAAWQHRISAQLLMSKDHNYKRQLELVKVY